jgi:hypothetical protein
VLFVFLRWRMGPCPVTALPRPALPCPLPSHCHCHAVTLPRSRPLTPPPYPPSNDTHRHHRRQQLQADTDIADLLRAAGAELPAKQQPRRATKSPRRASTLIDIEVLLLPPGSGSGRGGHSRGGSSAGSGGSGRSSGWGSWLGGSSGGGGGGSSHRSGRNTSKAHAPSMCAVGEEAEAAAPAADDQAASVAGQRDRAITMTETTANAVELIGRKAEI